MKKILSVLGTCGLVMCSSSAFASGNCGDVNNILFECTTKAKQTVLLCADNGNYTYSLTGNGTNNSEIFTPQNSFKLYNWNGNQEYVSFFKGSSEFKIYAEYSKKDDPNNIFDDNISGGVSIVRNGKKNIRISCAQTPDSINFSNLIKPKQKS